MANFPASLLILNGKSADNQPLREAITLLRDEGIQIHVRVTWEKGDAQRYVDEARRLGVETVIAGGGDGTINEVSTALIQIRDGVAPALGLLPLGTANDFATSAGIPEALDKALKLAIAGNAMEIDMAGVNDKTCFINMATGGFGTRITTETPEKLKAALGGVSYLIHGLMRLTAPQRGLIFMRRMKSRLIWMANHSADKNFILRCCLAHYAVGCRRTARCYVNNTSRWPDALTSGFSSLNSGDGDFAIQIDILYGINQLHAISHRFLKGFTSQN